MVSDPNCGHELTSVKITRRRVKTYLYPKAALKIMTHKTTAFGVCGTLMYIHQPVATNAAAIYGILLNHGVKTKEVATHDDCSGQ